MRQRAIIKWGLSFFMVVFLLGCPSKGIREGAPRQQVIQTSMQLIKCIKSRDYECVNNMHYAGNTDLPCYEVYGGYKAFVDRLSIYLKDSVIDDSKIEIIDDNKLQNENYRFNVDYIAIDNKDYKVAIRITFMDEIGGHEIGFITEEYTRKAVPDTVSHEFQELLELRRKQLDSLEKR